jgi:FK506-binding nuclear protein
VLQCNVGNKIPIKLCSLNPKLAETCHLEIEFEEVDDVVFSVIGQSSIHLSGYYVRASSRSNVGDDESYPSRQCHVFVSIMKLSDYEVIPNM